VWLIENNRIMTKNRMLEVYFNIIEWGRDVYGIGEASRYYFGKSPSELTIGESIYLASIVPHPKTGLYSFEPDGTLRPGLAGYFNLIGNLMAGHGRAQRDSSNEYGFNEVRLKESMRREVAPVSQSVADSLIKQDDEEKAVPVVVVEPEVKKPTFFQRLFGKKDTSVVAKKEEVKKEDVKAKLKADIKKLRDAEEQKELLIDTAGKTRKEIRQEKRRLRDEEKQAEKVLKELVKE
jgi:hypothetical protein